MAFITGIFIWSPPSQAILREVQTGFYNVNIVIRSPISRFNHYIRSDYCLHRLLIDTCALSWCHWNWVSTRIFLASYTLPFWVELTQLAVKCLHGYSKLIGCYNFLNIKRWKYVIDWYSDRIALNLELKVIFLILTWIKVDNKIIKVKEWFNRIILEGVHIWSEIG